MKLKGKVAVVTGGSSGIGLAIAHAYTEEGASVVIFGRNADSLAAAERELGDSAFAVQGDVTSTADLGRLYDATAERLGAIDVLAANAGAIHFTPLGEATEEDFDIATEVNFKGAFLTVNAAVRHLADGASVIVTSSALTSTPVAGLSAFMAAKAAVKTLARDFAVELAPRGVRVNALSPGVIPPPGSELPEGYVSQIPLDRYGTPEDVARMAVVLASEESAYVTGEDVAVGGGIGMGWVPPAS
ncbi:MAG: SDR family NAD(P)-dependent oxidoreductase [Solirubrobacterales bacterium]